MARNVYTADDSAYIRATAGLLPWHEIAENIGRSTRSVQIFASIPLMKEN